MSVRWIWWCLVAFGFSFAFDYRAPDIGFGASGTGGSLLQYLMLLVAMGAGTLAALIGWRHLLIRPGVYFILAWWGYLVLAGVVSLIQGNDPSRILRLMLAPVLIGFGMTTVHVAACAGISVARIMKVFLTVCVVNMVWQTGFAYATSGAAILETRPELSPGVRFVFAWSASCLLLARKIPRNAYILLGLAVAICVVCMTRSAVIYLGAAIAGASGCLLLAVLWKQLSFSHMMSRFGRFAGIGFGGTAMVVAVVMAIPTLRDWWVDRLFYSDGGGATTEDMSILMRKAEAKAMFDLLNQEPSAYVWGRGYGASYYWDDSYLPELVLVFPDPDNYPDEIYTCGHSLWTYALFSSGTIGFFSWLMMYAGPSFMSVRSVWIFSRLEGIASGKTDELHLWFLPAVALWTMFCSSFLENPFDNRLAGPLTGMAAGLMQLFVNRTWELAHRGKNQQSPAELPPLRPLGPPPGPPRPLPRRPDNALPPPPPSPPRLT